MTVPSNLILVGMPACGKSTVGVLVAKVLGLDFVDTDLLLQRKEGARLHEILERAGTAGFLASEDSLLSSLQMSQTVVSTGGSAVYHQRGMSHLKQLGPVVWIDVPYAEIERRLKDMATRGVVLAPCKPYANSTMSAARFMKSGPIGDLSWAGKTSRVRWPNLWAWSPRSRGARPRISPRP